jgi:hypothetical protein
VQVSNISFNVGKTLQSPRPFRRCRSACSISPTAIPRHQHRLSARYLEPWVVLPADCKLRMRGRTALSSAFRTEEIAVNWPYQSKRGYDFYGLTLQISEKLEKRSPNKNPLLFLPLRSPSPCPWLSKSFSDETSLKSSSRMTRRIVTLRGIEASALCTLSQWCWERVGNRKLGVIS